MKNNPDMFSQTFNLPYSALTILTIGERVKTVQRRISMNFKNDH